MSHFEGFEEVYVRVKSDLAGDLKIRTLRGGSKGGPPLVLLHGYPQTSYIFHKIANKLVDAGYTLIIPDLRGYGKSSKPKAGEKHEEYSKREMANDIIQVVKHFGYERFDLIAHDRGARVAHRLCLDHPKAVRNLMLLDIAPTLFMFESTDQEFATRYWHWFFQLLPTAEALIAADPETYFKTATWNYKFDPVARKEYFDSFSSPEGIHGVCRSRFKMQNAGADLLIQSCEDYRAAASIDLDHDRADRKAGKKLQVEKLRVLWGSQGLIPKYGDVPGVWKQYCDDSVEVSGRAVESNHYIPEMAPEDLYNEILELVPPK